jgi:hypothetical protein
MSDQSDSGGQRESISQAREAVDRAQQAITADRLAEAGVGPSRADPFN